MSVLCASSLAIAIFKGFSSFSKRQSIEIKSTYLVGDSSGFGISYFLQTKTEN
jgi:hypothetical protein